MKTIIINVFLVCVSSSSYKVILRKTMFFLFCFLTEMKSFLLYVVSKYFMSFKK